MDRRISCRHASWPAQRLPNLCAGFFLAHTLPLSRNVDGSERPLAAVHASPRKLARESKASFFGSGTKTEKDRSSGNWPYTVVAGKARWESR